MIKIIYRMAMNDKIYTELNELSLSKNVKFFLYNLYAYGNSVKEQIFHSNFDLQYIKNKQFLILSKLIKNPMKGLGQLKPGKIVRK